MGRQSSEKVGGENVSSTKKLPRPLLIPDGEEGGDIIVEGRSSIDGDTTAPAHLTAGFGKKTISLWGSYCLNINNANGPAMVLLPLIYQEAGWLTPNIAMVVVWIFSSFAASMLCEAMQRVPGNQSFTKRVEFSTLVGHYWGPRAYVATQLLFNLSLQASNIAAMIVSAQVLDNFFIYSVGHSYGLNYTDLKWVKSSTNYQTKWESENIISLGFVACMLICVPFGWFSLEENMWFQWVSLAGLTMFTGEFLYQFSKDADANWSNGDHLVSTFEVTGQSHVLGLAVFVFAWVVTIPSWLNEKKPGVSVNKSIWVPSTIALFSNVLVGLGGSLAYKLLDSKGNPVDGSDNILNELSASGQPQVTIWSAYLWNLTTLIPGIPVLGIMVKYNLQAGKVCGPKAAFFWGVLAPWLVTAFCYNSNVLVEICNWVAITVQGFINLVVPCAIFRSALIRYPRSEDLRGHYQQKTPTSSTRALLSDTEAQKAKQSFSPLRSPDAQSWDPNRPFTASSRSSMHFVAGASTTPPTVPMEDSVGAVPSWVPITPKTVSTLIMGFFAIACTGAIGLSIVAIFDSHLGP